MRALIAMVTCVILLAIIQGSYLVIDAHHSAKSSAHAHHVTDDAHLEKHHHKQEVPSSSATSSSQSEHRKNHHQPQGHIQQPIHKPDVNGRTKPDCHGPDCFNAPDHQRELSVDLVPLKPSRGNRTGTQRILYQILKENIPPQYPIKSADVKKNETESHLHPHKVNTHNTSKSSRAHHFLPQGDKLLLEPMQGDTPLVDSEMRRHFQLDEPVRHHRRQHRRKSRSHPKRTECITHDDCKHGDCCLTRHQGPAYCEMNKKEAGARCVDSCTCQEGLECFVAKVNKYGKLRKRNGAHPLLGKCQDPNAPTSLPGYWATGAPRGGIATTRVEQSTTTTRTTTTSVFPPSTSQGSPRARETFMQFP